MTNTAPTRAEVRAPAPDPPGHAVVRTVGLTKTYGTQNALDGVDLTVPAGSIVGLIGPSGCGKSTLIKVLTGIIRPSSGEVAVFDREPAEADDAHRSRFGYMPQLPVLFPNLSVWANLNFIASMYGVSLRHRRKRMMELLELVDLAGDRRKRLYECSGGMQRRLALAATLVHDPELLFLDEPTAGVDPILRERFWSHFRALRDEGRTVVVPTQYVGEAVSCDLVAVMSAGRLIALLPPDELCRKGFGGDPLDVRIERGWMSRDAIDHVTDLPFVRSVRRTDDGLLVVVDDAERDAEHLKARLDGIGVDAAEVERRVADFDGAFVEIIEADRREVAAR